jgi:hypothetical protein
VAASDNVGSEAESLSGELARGGLAATVSGDDSVAVLLDLLQPPNSSTINSTALEKSIRDIAYRPVVKLQMNPTGGLVVRVLELCTASEVNLNVVRHMDVVFCSAKQRGLGNFAERNTTLNDCMTLNVASTAEFGYSVDDVGVNRIFCAAARPHSCRACQASRSDDLPISSIPSARSAAINRT